MGRYLREARRHAEKIEYYYDHAGRNGYVQAVYHWDRLPGLVDGAMHSKKDKGEAPLIHAIMKSMQPMMDEMKKREIGSNSA